jgi:hypothetical protein
MFALYPFNKRSLSSRYVFRTYLYSAKPLISTYAEMGNA